MDFLDLRFATVADVVPLTGVNRAFVRQGVSIMVRLITRISALKDVSGWMKKRPGI